MKAFEKILDMAHIKLTKEDYDNLIIIGGDVGKGKSNLGLHALDIWYNKLNKTLVKEDIKHCALDMIQFTKDLKELKRFEMIIYDEAGDLSNLRQMDKYNYRITLAYQVIRGLNLFTILILPSVFRLNPYFVVDRCKTYIHVYKRDKNRAYYAVWTRRKVEQMIHLNQNRRLKTPFVVRPDAYDHFRRYEGILKNEYDIKKNDKMTKVLDKLYNDVIGHTKIDESLFILKRAKEKLGAKNTAEIFDISERTVFRRLEKLDGMIADGKT